MTATIDPSNYSITVGLDIVESFAEDKWIEADYNEDQWNHVVSNDGITERYKNLNKSGTISITLTHSAPLNKTWRALSKLDWESGEGIIQILVTNTKTGTTEIKGIDCYIPKPPPLSVGNRDSVTWTFHVSKLLM